MILSPEQINALAKIQHWLSNPMKQTFTLAGFAGTGKTTLLQKFINDQSDPVMCLAPTGKAASVLSKKLKNARVTTVHSALYSPILNSTKLVDQLQLELSLNPDSKELKEALDEAKRQLSKKDVKFSRKEDCAISSGQLVVVDEASMVTRTMQRDLEATMAKVLYVGDPGQLPPVNDKGFFGSKAPDALLSKVHRQALDSPIIRISMEIRAGQSVYLQDIPGFRKVNKEDLTDADWLNVDQVITGTNDARRRINRFFRRKLGRKSWWPEKGDKLICLRNENSAEEGYTNGIQAVSIHNSAYIPEFGEIMGDILYDQSQVRYGIPFYRYPFQAHYDQDAVEDPLHLRQGVVRDFDYAYAVTVHKSQGSEWDRVLLADDAMKSNDTEFRKRWLYTAVTRAKEHLTWVV